MKKEKGREKKVKMIFVILTVIFLLFAGCDNIGEDPLPSPGPNPDGSVTLFVNGTVYNFDYTAYQDGIEIVDYSEAKPDGTGGSQFLDMSSKEGGSFAGSEGYVTGTLNSEKSIYSQRGISSMAFLNDLKNNYEGKWKFTLFDAPPLLLSDFNRITFWAKWDWGPEVGSMPSQVGVKISVWSSSGILIRDGELPANLAVIPGNPNSQSSEIGQQKNGKWYKYSVSLNKEWAPGVKFPASESIKQWQISVPQNAGRIYVDEIVLTK